MGASDLYEYGRNSSPLPFPLQVSPLAQVIPAAPPGSEDLITGAISQVLRQKEREHDRDNDEG